MEQNNCNGMQKQLHLHQGAAVAQWYSTPPLAVDAAYGQAASFYSDAHTAVNQAFLQRLLPCARAAYEEDTNPKKRFSFLRYTGIYSVTVMEESDGVLSVFRVFTWKRGNDILAEHAFAEVWARGGILLSPLCFCQKKALRSLAKTARLPLRALQSADFYLSGEQVCLLTKKGILHAPRADKAWPPFLPQKQKTKKQKKLAKNL